MKTFFPELYRTGYSKMPAGQYDKLCASMIRTATSIVEIEETPEEGFTSAPFWVEICATREESLYCNMEFGYYGYDFRDQPYVPQLKIPTCETIFTANGPCQYYGELSISALYWQFHSDSDRLTESRHHDILLKLFETYRQSLIDYFPERCTIFVKPPF